MPFQYFTLLQGHTSCCRATQGSHRPTTHTLTNNILEEKKHIWLHSRTHTVNINCFFTLNSPSLSFINIAYSYGALVHSSLLELIGKLQYSNKNCRIYSTWEFQVCLFTLQVFKCQMCCVFSYVFSNGLHERMHNHTCYICLIFLHCVFSNVTLNYLD